MSSMSLEELANLIVTTKKVTTLTGAGMSTESGIPDFRSSAGLWEKYPPEEYATMDAFLKDPQKVWKMLAEMQAMIRRAEPNPGHKALAQMERIGLLAGVITQNVDGLHKRAGSNNVVCFHGSSETLVCMRCGVTFQQDCQGAVEPDTFPPRCHDCDAILKPNVVFFGEPIPEEAFRKAAELVNDAETLMVVGTSATVAPASYIPHAAKRRGLMVVEINLESTILSKTCADETFLGRSGEILPALWKEIVKIT